MNTFFQNAIDRLIQKGFSPQEAKAIIGTIRSAEDYEIACKIQDDTDLPVDSPLGPRVARTFRHLDVCLLLKEASINVPSPNQVPAALATETAALTSKLLELQQQSSKVTEGSQVIVQALNQFAKFSLSLPS
jgi:hypothetical protein